MVQDLTGVEIQTQRHERTKTKDRNLVVHGREGVELCSEVIHCVQSLQEMAQRQRLLPPMSQRCSCPNGVLDLPPIDISHRKLPDLLGSERYADLGQERVPNLCFGRCVEIVEVKSDVDSRTEGIVDDLDSIGCKEENSTVVLKMTKAGRRRTCKQWVMSRTN